MTYTKYDKNHFCTTTSAITVTWFAYSKLRSTRRHIGIQPSPLKQQAVFTDMLTVF